MKTIFYIAIIISAAFSSATAQMKKNAAITIAQGIAVTIDGKIEEKEWQNASAFDLSGGGKVFFKHDGEYLYVAVRGAAKGWSHLYLVQEGSADVSVLHASAALGMTTYKQDKNNLWQPATPFAWDIRDRSLTPETNKKMTDYLAKNYWVASNNNMSSTNEIEFSVKPQNTLDKPLHVALIYASDAKNPQFFPASLKDDTLKADLIYGNTPNDLKFERDQWMKIVLESKKTPSK